MGVLQLPLVAAVFVVAAILGDFLNFWIGSKVCAILDEPSKLQGDYLGVPSSRDYLGVPSSGDYLGVPSSRDYLGVPSSRDYLGVP